MPQPGGRAGASGTHSAQAACRRRGCPQPPVKGIWGCQGPARSPGLACRSQGPAAHTGARSAPPQVPGQGWCHHALAPCGPEAIHSRPPQLPPARTWGQHGHRTGQWEQRPRLRGQPPCRWGPCPCWPHHPREQPPAPQRGSLPWHPHVPLPGGSHKLKFHLSQPGRLRLRWERAAPVTRPAPAARHAILLREQVPRPPPRPPGRARLCHAATATGTAPAWPPHESWFAGYWKEQASPAQPQRLRVAWASASHQPLQHRTATWGPPPRHCLPTEGAPPAPAWPPPLGGWGASLGMSPGNRRSCQQLEAGGSRCRGAPSRFPAGSWEAAGLRHGSRSQQPRLFLALDAARSRRPGNGVPGTARPQTALSGSATAGRQVQLAAARGRSGHGTGEGLGGPSGQAAAPHPQTPGFGVTVPPTPVPRAGIRPGQARLGPGVPGGHRGTASGVAACHCHVPWHGLAAGAQPGTAEAGDGRTRPLAGPCHEPPPR